MKDRVTRVGEALLKHPVWATFLVALTARLCLAVGIAVFRDGSLFQDDRGWLELAKLHHQLTSYEFYNYESWWNQYASFLWPIGFAFKLLGPYALAAQALSSLAGGITAAATTSLLRLHVSNRTALFTGLLVALYPSQILWSSLVLKDAYVWMSLSLLALLTGWWCRRTDLHGFTVGALGLAVLTLYLSHLRAHTLIVACFALVLALAWKSRTRQLGRLAVASLLLVLIPPLAGVGLGGIDLWRIGLLGMEDVRRAGAIEAATRVVETSASYQIATMEAEVQKLTDELNLLSMGEIPHDESVSAATRLDETPNNEIKHLEAVEAATRLDETPNNEIKHLEAVEAATRVIETPNNEIKHLEIEVKLIENKILEFGAWDGIPVEATITDDIRYLPSGLRVMVLDPLPHHLGRSSNLIFPFVEHLLWYPILILAMFGLNAIGRNSPELAFVFLLMVGLVTMWALVEGNFGTAYRHRGEFVWAVTLFAGIGAERLFQNRRARTSGMTSALLDVAD